ncbi:GNAT family N-acetyltransferase [Acidovorax sp. CCYZU-2555]|uniref:GNAT family N-acetyltransferase n=1 Tax=Acidovorax sp. CCYZU-2555 TaxID=2835042 RepID=UPI001BCBD46A|nr:GNAT family N-acetyltransferase [Acidovorax sp. CCYZU-2555]MBS7780098.1 GNAT family N-acetyltransferase [Acidovorax sp. CCYZU-2555]
MTEEVVCVKEESVSALGKHLRKIVAAFDVELRCVTPQDSDFLCELYASTRWEELAPTAWTDDSKRGFLAQQWAAQRQYYDQHYTRADHLIMVHRQGGRIGRLFIDAGAEIRLVDISLSPAWRGRGLGTLLLQALCRQADQLQRPVVAHVETFNPARRLYERLGFVIEDDNQIYLRLRRIAAVPEPTL